MTHTQGYTAESLAALETSHARLLMAAKAAIGSGSIAYTETNEYLISGAAFDLLLGAIAGANEVGS